ncbi:hypothetical protein PTKIN_Ptkin03bG0087400 [Pterospermum kingtungense]
MLVLMHPLVYGDYPSSMKKNAGSRLPAFTGLQSKQVKGSFDFIGLNFYFTMSVKDQPSSLEREDRDVTTDRGLELIRQKTRRNSSLEDWARVQSLDAYIGSVLDAIRLWRTRLLDLDGTLLVLELTLGRRSKNASILYTLSFILAGLNEKIGVKRTKITIFAWCKSSSQCRGSLSIKRGHA